MKKTLPILKTLLKTNQTVFSFKEVLILCQTDDIKTLKSLLSYHIKRGDLYHIRRGLYAKNSDYNRLELATKIFTPSYISFETVLRNAGIIFQYYSTIFVASYQSRNITCDTQIYSFKKIKSNILTNGAGIHINDTYSIASPERAFLDIIYHTKNYHFDNLEPLNWDKVYELLPTYDGIKSMKKRVDNYYQAYKKEVAHDT